MIKYISTRGPGQPKSFSEVLLSGMAPDGGLYIPETWPVFDRNVLKNLSGAPYKDVAAQIIGPFIGGDIENAAFHKMLSDIYEGGAFDHQAVAPLQQIGSSLWLMELFHGPTFSFKDYALQLLGRLFDHVLEQRGERITIVGATSGDTGSAAIEACRHCRNVDIFILHPEGRTSDIQRRQMTTVTAENVHNIALQGNFDDCQSLVKAMFADPDMREDLHLSAVNSINWARIMAQTVYYVAASLALGAPERDVSFVVPTGNFGNIYAAWVARKMGLPIRDLVVASNRNDILTRFFESGAMTAESVVPSLSPSMDIQISSNFERFLCDLVGRDHKALSELMGSFKDQGVFEINQDLIEKARSEFASYRCTDGQTLAAMRDCYEKTGVQIDPHTAVAYHAALEHRKTAGSGTPLVFLGCAHPAKFPEAVRRATGKDPVMPDRLEAVMQGEERYDVLPNDAQAVKAHIYKSVR